MNIPILIDGPHFINRVLELGIAAEHVSNQLSIAALRTVIGQRLAQIPGIVDLPESAEFICSRKRFGPDSTKFTQQQQTKLLDRLRSETGVYVDLVDIPGTSEKGVDMTISGRLDDYASSSPATILVTTDRDFIPALRKLRHKTKVVLVALSEVYPVELRNEAHATIALHDAYRDLFNYEYPRYYIDDFDENRCAVLLAQADDRVHNQIRVTEDGYVFVSKEVGTRNLDNIRFRFETFAAYNGYVGPRAASDADYVARETSDIRDAWKRGSRGYIDYPGGSEE